MIKKKGEDEDMAYSNRRRKVDKKKTEWVQLKGQLRSIPAEPELSISTLNAKAKTKDGKTSPNSTVQLIKPLPFSNASLAAAGSPSTPGYIKV